MPYSSPSAPKSLYVFLCALLGVLLFLILHRVLVFVLLLLQIQNYPAFGWDMPEVQFLAIDYATLTITLMIGAWYGIWLGSFWYQQVYEDGGHKGLLYHLISSYWPGRRKTYRLAEKIQQISQSLAEEASDVGRLAREIPENLTHPRPIKRRLVRKSLPKKTKD